MRDRERESFWGGFHLKMTMSFQMVLAGIADLVSRVHYFLELIMDFERVMEINKRNYVIKYSRKFEDSKQCQQASREIFHI
jgi:hypothetical protein